MSSTFITITCFTHFVLSVRTRAFYPYSEMFSLAIRKRVTYCYLTSAVLLIFIPIIMSSSFNITNAYMSDQKSTYVLISSVQYFSKNVSFLSKITSLQLNLHLHAIYKKIKKVLTRKKNGKRRLQPEGFLQVASAAKAVNSSSKGRCHSL